jgi:low affinity Fe/Cu permease
MTDDGFMPSDVTSHVSRFDRFSSVVARSVSHAWFFAACVLLIVVWLPSYWLFSSVDTWQLCINSATTIITYLLVALLTNTQSRDTKALNHKLNAIADGLADLMEHMANTGALETEEQVSHLQNDLVELRKAVGIERYESA